MLLDADDGPGPAMAFVRSIMRERAMLGCRVGRAGYHAFMGLERVYGPVSFSSHSVMKQNDRWRVASIAEGRAATASSTRESRASYSPRLRYTIASPYRRTGA